MTGQAAEQRRRLLVTNLTLRGPKRCAEPTWARSLRLRLQSAMSEHSVINAPADDPARCARLEGTGVLIAIEGHN